MGNLRMEKLPAELIVYLGQFLSQKPLASLVRAARRYHVLLTATLYDSAIECIDPSLKIIVDTDLRPFEYILPKPWFGYRHTMVRCAKYWQSEPVVNYFRKKPMEAILAPYMDDMCSVYEIGETLLHQFAMMNNLQLTRLLLERGADPDVPTALMMTPIHHAILKGAGILMIQLLLDFGANILAKDDRLESPMSFAASCGNIEVIGFVMGAVRSRGGDIFAPDISGYTPLHRAAMRGNTNAIHLLLQHGADPLKSGEPGGTALHCAVLSGKTDAVSLLIDSFECIGGDISITNGRNKTALHFAVQCGNTDITRLLIQHGCNRLIKDENGDTALAVALKKSVNQSIRILLE